jgi:16S rRNA (uracil1498-N3)-methyltransferase
VPENAPPLFFHDGEAPPGTTVRLGAEEAEHAGRSVRLKPGDPLTLVDGRGMVSLAQVLASKARHFDARVVSSRVAPRPPGPRLTLGAALIRGPRYDMIIEKATELGVSAIRPLVTRHTEIRPGEGTGRSERWRRLAIAAMKQSQRFYLPEIGEPTSLDELLAGEEFDLVLVADPGEPAGLPAVSGRILLLVGPEGGWHETERAALETSGAACISLGNHRLRSETAAIALVVLARAAAGAMGKCLTGEGSSL